MGRYKAGIATRERILDATRELIGEGGLEAATLQAICQRAGIGAGSFYNLFRAKEDAVIQVVRQAITAVDPDPAGAGNDTVEELTRAYISFIADEPELARIYLQIAVTGALAGTALGPRFLRHHQRRVERFRDALLLARPELSEEDAAMTAESLLAMLNGLAFRWLLEPGFDFRRHAERAALEAAAT